MQATEMHVLLAGMSCITMHVLHHHACTTIQGFRAVPQFAATLLAAAHNSCTANGAGVQLKVSSQNQWSGALPQGQQLTHIALQGC